MRLSKETSNWRTIAWLAISLACLCFGTTAFADDDRGWKSERHHQRHGRHDRDHRRHSSKHAHDHRYAQRKAYARHESKRHDDRHRYAGWHYHRGRHWAPASYRGRYCTDRRHFHDVHYHVAYDDYYEYYYPRYRYYGPLTRGASLIITVPLF